MNKLAAKCKDLVSVCCVERTKTSSCVLLTSRAGFSRKRCRLRGKTDCLVTDALSERCIGEMADVNPLVLVKFFSSMRKARERTKRSMSRRKEFERKLAKQRIMMAFLVCSALINTSVPRTLWQKERASYWWEQIVNESFTASDWLSNFRMSRSTFLYLCNELRSEIAKTDTDMRPAIPVEKRVAMTLWFMSTNSDYRTIGHLFGVSTASVCKVRQEVCQAIVRVLLRKYIRIPTESTLSAVLSGFARKGFPQCAGAIDGCHIPIEAPQDCPADYHNRKGWYSVILQGLVDHTGCFTDINVGWPGRVHDSRVLQNSELYAKGESGNLFPQQSVVMGGVRVPVVIIGDAAYPLKPWLMKPYINSGSLSVEKQNFNHHLSHARIIVEHAFGLLKGRWRCLRTRLAVRVAEVPELVGACCILHNICQLHGEGFDTQWLEDNEYESPNDPAPSVSRSGGDRVRTALTEYFKDH